MTEDFQVQQQRPSATPYLLGGALVGGATGAGAAYGIKSVRNFISEPGKYNDFQDLINEKDDAFTKSMETVEDKDLVTKAKEARQRVAEGNAQWDKDLAAYLEANKNGVTEGTSEALTKAEGDLATARTALDKKRQELIDKEVEKLNAENKSGKKLSVRAQRMLDDKKAQLEKEIKALEKDVKLINKVIKSDMANKLADFRILLDDVEKSGTREQVKKVRKGLQAAEAEFKKGVAEIVKEMEVPADISKKGKKAVEAWKKEQQKMYENYVYDVIAERTYNTANVGDEVKKLAENRKSASEYINSLVKGSKANTQEELLKAAERQKTVTGMKLEKLKAFSTKYNDYAEKVASEGTGARTFTIEVKGKIRRWLTGGNLTITEGPEKEIQTFINSLSADEKKAFERLVGEAPDGDIAKSIKTAIKEAEEKINKINEAASNLKSTQARIVELGGEGAKIERGRIIDAAGKQVNVKPKEIKLATGIEIPTTNTIEKLKREISRIEQSANGTLSPEEILAKAKANVTDAMLEAENTAVKKAEDLVETEKGKLPKVQKTEQELTEIFVKEHGKKGEKVTEAVKKDLEDGLKKLWEKGAKNKGKMAAVIGSATALGAIVGLMFKPNNQA